MTLWSLLIFQWDVRLVQQIKRIWSYRAKILNFPKNASAPFTVAYYNFVIPLKSVYFIFLDPHHSLGQFWVHITQASHVIKRAYH